MLLDTLRPPSSVEPNASAYKDWLHLNFADPQTGAIGLINTSLHGPPWEEQGRAVGVALAHFPQFGWKSHVEILPSSQANIAPASISLRDIAVAMDPRTSRIHVSSRGSSNPIQAHFTVEPRGAPLDFEREMPLGSGWISWRLISDMSLGGEWTVQEHPQILQNAPAYHDHNWGRWHWGDDFGWEWGCFLRNPAHRSGAAFVFARTTDRTHRRLGKPFLAVDHPSAHRRFGADSITVDTRGQLDVPLHRIPGGMAALHQEMAEPSLPASVRIRAAQGADSVVILFVGRAAAQIITADPYTGGYSFIHEIVGEYSSSGHLGNVTLETSGYAVFEYVT